MTACIALAFPLMPPLKWRGKKGHAYVAAFLIGFVGTLCHLWW